MKQQPSAIAMTSLSGHSGGTTATITNIVRRKSNPRQPRTGAQSAARGTLAYLSKLWGSLTSEEQDAWITAAPNKIKVKNGVAIALKGNTYFIEVNTNIITAGGTVITVPVAPVALPNFPFLPYWSTSYSVDDPEISFQVGYNTEYQDLPTDPWVAVWYWTKWKGPGRRSLGKTSTIIPSIFSFQGNFGTGFTFDNLVNDGPIPPYENARTNVALKYINKNTGQVWTPFSEQVIATNFSSLVQDYLPGSENAGVVTTGTPPNLTTVLTVEGTTGTYDFSVWKPMFFMTGWGDEDFIADNPANIPVPASAIVRTDSTHLTITFGPAVGNAAHATAAGQFNTVIIGWENVSTGEKEWETGITPES